MSDRITDLLDRAEPHDVAPLDYDHLTTRGRRRRWTKRASGALAGVAVLAVGGLGLAELAQPTGLQVVAGGPDATADQPPVGEWSTVATDLSHGTNRTTAGIASDGRLVVYGGTRDVNPADDSGGLPRRDGLVIDPDTGDAVEIPTPPIPATKYSFFEPLAGDRLLVFGGVSSEGAYYDLAAEKWTVIPAAPTGSIATNIRAWDGETLVVGDSFETDAPEGSGLTNPELWRWNVGADDWTKMPRAPIDAGRMESAFRDGQLAVWTNPATDLSDGIVGSGYVPDAEEQRETRLAVLDVAAGEWTTVVPRDELPELAEGAEAEVAWHNGRVVILPMPPYGEGNTFGPDIEPEPFAMPAPAALDPASGAWETLDAYPKELQRMRTRFGLLGGNDLQLTSDAAPVQVGVDDDVRAALLPDGSWTAPVVADGIHLVGDQLVALGGRSSTLSGDLAGAVWTGQGWRDATDAEAGERVDASIATTDSALYVVGGHTYPLIGGPNHHRDVLRFTP